MDKVEVIYITENREQLRCVFIDNKYWLFAEDILDILGEERSLLKVLDWSSVKHIRVVNEEFEVVDVQQMGEETVVVNDNGLRRLLLYAIPEVIWNHNEAVELDWIFRRKVDTIVQIRDWLSV